SVLAGELWGRAIRGGVDVRYRGASVYGDRGGGAGIFWRDAARRSSRRVDSAAAGAADRGRIDTSSPAGGRLAACYRASASGSVDGRHGSTPYRSAAAVDAARLGLSVQLDAGHHPDAAAAEHPGGSGG